MLYTSISGYLLGACERAKLTLKLQHHLMLQGVTREARTAQFGHAKWPLPTALSEVEFQTQTPQTGGCKAIAKIGLLWVQQSRLQSVSSGMRHAHECPRQFRPF